MNKLNLSFDSVFVAKIQFAFGVIDGRAFRITWAPAGTLGKIKGLDFPAREENEEGGGRRRIRQVSHRCGLNM